jgi:hypothetical protein
MSDMTLKTNNLKASSDAPLDPIGQKQLEHQTDARALRAGQATLRESVILKSIASISGREKQELLARIKSGGLEFTRRGLGIQSIHSCKRLKTSRHMPAG